MIRKLRQYVKALQRSGGLVPLGKEIVAEELDGIFGSMLGSGSHGRLKEGQDFLPEVLFGG